MIFALMIAVSAYAAEPTPTMTPTDYQRGWLDGVRAVATEVGGQLRAENDAYHKTATAIARKYANGWPEGQWIVTATATARFTNTASPTATVSLTPNAEKTFVAVEATCVARGHLWTDDPASLDLGDSKDETWLGGAVFYVEPKGWVDTPNGGGMLAKRWWLARRCRRCGLWRERR